MVYTQDAVPYFITVASLIKNDIFPFWNYASPIGATSVIQTTNSVASACLVQLHMITTLLSRSARRSQLHYATRLMRIQLVAIRVHVSVTGAIILVVAHGPRWQICAF